MIRAHSQKSKLLGICHEESLSRALQVTFCRMYACTLQNVCLRMHCWSPGKIKNEENNGKRRLRTFENVCLGLAAYPAGGERVREDRRKLCLSARASKTASESERERECACARAREQARERARARANVSTYKDKVKDTYMTHMLTYTTHMRESAGARERKGARESTWNRKRETNIPKPTARRSDLSCVSPRVLDLPKPTA